jgi:hypothetical protein
VEAPGERKNMMKIVLYEKKREDADSMFRPVKNERLIWLINFISQVECDKVSSIIRLDSLLSGKQINTDLYSFILKIVD